VPEKKAVAKSSVPEATEELKMVLCINQELNMGKGKVAAQCAHAAVGVCDKFQRKMPTWFAQWRTSGQAKITLKASGTAMLNDLSKAGEYICGSL
jgi:peptidyl-tRNA hydrolase, PTH2 family